MKIGIFGGSFNPIHNGHLSVMRKIIGKNLVDEVWVMPCKKHPFDKTLESEVHRSDMIRLAINKMPQIKFCEYELQQTGKNYTLHTLQELKKKHTCDFYLIIGSDILGEVTQWHQYPILSKEAKFLVFKRNGYEIVNPGINIVAAIDTIEKNISSTEIREEVKAGKSISQLVPVAVEEYIKQNKLYQK